MRAVRLSSAIALVAVALVGTGCKKEAIPAPEPMPSPPVFDPAKDKVATFIEGKWCPEGEVDPAAVEKFGLEPGSEIDVSQHWIFKSDGTFEYGRLGYKTKITGTWMLQPKGVSLLYEAWDGEPLSARLSRLKQAEEGGTQAAIAEVMAYESTMGFLSKMDYIEVSEDMKGLVFTELGGNENSGGMFSMVSQTGLIRMK